ncbi:hypothetical protein MO973_24605 [Paenibacillus sp. TRM 82003]|nr:hypothetical protein [Paenibacillus sp. TRM 82003]MCI3923413.1 hypothetical protein [Paenibacillus sp. TRM 82003]
MAKGLAAMSMHKFRQIPNLVIATDVFDAIMAENIMCKKAKGRLIEALILLGSYGPNKDFLGQRLRKAHDETFELVASGSSEWRFQFTTDLSGNYAIIDYHEN